MPHKCTRCESIFIDGASVILSGCPNCGWNKFLYVKDEELENPVTEGAEESDSGEVHAVIDETSSGKSDETSSGKSDESSSDESSEETSDTSSEPIVREIDDMLGIEKKEPSVTEEDDGERVESVRILGPGSYELNLDSLLDRKEIVMAIKEDGAYALHLGSVFKDNKGKKDKKKKKR